MLKSEQTELHRLLTQLAAGDFYSNTQPLTCHPAFKRLQQMATAPRYPEGNEHQIRAIGWQELASMLKHAEHWIYDEPLAKEQAGQMEAAAQAIHAEMQRRLLKLVPEGEAITGDVLTKGRES